MAKTRKIPQRSCVGCQNVFPKRQLIRVVRDPDGTVSLDPTGKKPGRGAYVCPKAECLDYAVRTNRLQRSLEVPVPDEVLDNIKTALPSIRPDGS